MGTKFKTEHEFVLKCLPIFRARADHVFLEVPIFSGSADMVLVKRRTISAVEFKISSWKRALAQATKHALAVDFSYICIPKPKTIKAMANIQNCAEECGVGLLYYFEQNDVPQIEEAVAPRRSRLFWPRAKEGLEGLLSSRTSERSERSNE